VARSDIARRAIGAFQWLGVGLVAVVVVVVGLLWPDSRAEIEAPPAPVADASVPEAATGPVPQPPVAPEPPPAEPQPWDAIDAETVRVPVDPDAAEQTQEDILDELEAEPNEDAVVPEPEPIQLPRGEIEKVEGERDFILHTVVPLETVDQIAHRYDVRPDALRMWNGIRGTTNKRKPGTKLRVKPNQIPPPRVRLEYTVRPRDTWWGIGTRFGVDSIDLRAQNRRAGGRLEVGQRIQMWIDPVVFEWIAVEDDGHPETVRPGAVGIGPPYEGVLVNGVELPESDYYTLRLPRTSYGTTHAVQQVQQAIVLFEARSEYPRPLVFGSMSAKHGGPLRGHRSHQTGRDLDINIPLRPRYPVTFAAEDRYVDWIALWHLVTALADTGQVIVIFFEYERQKLLAKAARRAHASREERRRILQWPRGAKARALVTHSPGHHRHIHVRFTCGVHEVECTGLGADEIGD
jgi:murein endopeptidase/nucleoid-associated protein YgaU